MYHTGNTTKNSSIQLGRNIVVNEPCSDIDYRYGPYRSTSEALEWIDKHLRNLGLTVGIIEDGKIVEYWFKSDINTLVKKVDDSQELYTPSDSIPNDAFSETIQASKSQLEGQTVSQILDKILFKDQSAFINANAGNCNITATNAQREVKSTHEAGLYTTTVATASYGYPAGTKTWTAGSKSVSPQEIVFGANNTCSCTFTLTGIPTLKSSYGVTPSSQPSYQTSITKTATITGFYKCGFSYKYPNPSWTNFQVSKEGSTTLQTTTSSEYVYVLLPTDLTIDGKVGIKHPLNDTYPKISVLPDIIGSNSQESSITTNYKFNIWKLAKAELNSDGHPTPNAQPIQITIKKRNN